MIAAGIFVRISNQSSIPAFELTRNISYFA